MGRQAEKWQREWSGEKNASWQSGEAVETVRLSNLGVHPSLLHRNIRRSSSSTTNPGRRVPISPFSLRQPCPTHRARVLPHPPTLLHPIPYQTRPSPMISPMLSPKLPHLRPRQEIGRQSGHPHTTHTISTTRPPRRLPGSIPCNSRARWNRPPLPYPPPLPLLLTLKKRPGLPLVRYLYPPLLRRFTRCRRPPRRRASIPPSRTSIQPSLGPPLQAAHTTSLRGSTRTRAHLRNLTDAILPIYRNTNA